MAEMAIIALLVPLGLGLSLHKMSQKVSNDQDKTRVAKVTELSPPPSPREQPESEAALVHSYEVDWAKLPAQTAPAEFILAGRGSGRKESALAVLKHRRELALQNG